MQTYDEEYWLSEEMREIPLPGGGTRPHTMMRIYWGSYDALISEHDFTPEKLIDLCMESALHYGRPFDVAFPDCLAYLDREYTRMQQQYGQRKQPAKSHSGPVSKVQIKQLRAEKVELEASRPKVAD